MAYDAKLPQCRLIRTFGFNLMRMGIGIACALAGLLFGGTEVVRAEDIGACRFERFGSGTVTRVIDGRSFVLEDGREVRITGIEIPPHSTPAGASAKTALEAMLLGQSVELRGPELVKDRYDRTVAFVQRTGEAATVAGEMLARGHARVGVQVGDTTCAVELLSRERVARAAKLGLWSEPYYEVIEAGNGSQLRAARGHFAVVEGKVLSVRESGGTIYLNFGRRWSEALTVTISKRQERIFSGAGMSPKRLENRAVRVRGWIEERNGPRIEANRPEQIEVAGLN